MKTKDFKLDLKSVNDDGTFEGYLSVFGVVDLGNDLVEQGAFTKTLQEQGGKFVMLWQHDTKQPIGEFEAQQDQYGLKVKGTLTMGLKQAQEALALLKAGVIRGLSIGYKSVKDQMVKGIRHLKEIKLYEGSIVTFPMLPVAQIDLGTVKSDAQRKDFLEELTRAQVYMMRGLMIQSLCHALDDTVYAYGDNVDAASIMQESQDSIDQFSAAYMEHLPKLLEMWGMKSASESKAGRRISAQSRSQIEEAISGLQALLADVESTSEEEAAPAEPKAATHDADEPVEIPADSDHSLANFTNEMKELFTWNN